MLAALLPHACERRDVTIEGPTSGRKLSANEEADLQRVADASFREARALLEGLPPKLTIIVTFGKDVIPETGESGSAGYPGNIGLTFDPDRDVGATIRTYARAGILHELAHLARESAVKDARGTVDRVVSEGLATAFERDMTKATPPWGEAPSDIAEQTRAMLERPDRTDAPRWAVHRTGTFLVDRATARSNKSAAALVRMPTAEVLKLAAFE